MLILKIIKNSNYNLNLKYIKLFKSICFIGSVLAILFLYLSLKVVSNLVYVIDSKLLNNLSKSNGFICNNVSKIDKCELHSGDILLLRYINQNTLWLRILGNPYFVHAAMVTDDNRIIESPGFGNLQADIREIQIENSDWLDDRVESWVIIRPKIDVLRKQYLVDMARQIQLSNVKFGLTSDNKSNKIINCSQFIWQIYYKNGLMQDTTTANQIISPDYLLLEAINNSDSFEIVGFKFSREI